MTTADGVAARSVWVVFIAYLTRLHRGVVMVVFATLAIRSGRQFEFDIRNLCIPL